MNMWFDEKTSIHNVYISSRLFIIDKIVIQFILFQTINQNEWKHIRNMAKFDFVAQFMNAIMFHMMIFFRLEHLLDQSFSSRFLQ